MVGQNQAELGKVAQWETWKKKHQMGIIFVNFDMFTTLILRNCYDEME